MTIKSSVQIPLLKGPQYQHHYFRDSPGVGEDPTDHFAIYNRCMLRDNILAHRLDFYMIFLVNSGEGLHTFGSNEHYIRKNMLGFIGPHVVSSWRADHQDNRGFLCSFSEEFFLANRSDKQYLSNLPFFQLGGNPVLCLSDDEAEEFTTLFKMIEKESKQNNSSTDTLRGFLQVMLGKAIARYGQLKQQNHDDHPSSGLRIVKAFMEAYMIDFGAIRNGREIRLKKISDYARQLGVSQNYLNDTIKSITGKSAGQLMKSQLLKQASVCLKHSTKSISEISYLLGFEDPSYFTRFYKKHTGQLPSDKRKAPVKSAMDPV
ncbi:MAG TPA: AraC family transcriptional regulator [Chryseolinea sp.]|nr:AraC family transcriptional regulator [Chryseolinea sp.]